MRFTAFCVEFMLARGGCPLSVKTLIGLWPEGSKKIDTGKPEFSRLPPEADLAYALISAYCNSRTVLKYAYLLLAICMKQAYPGFLNSP